MSNIETNAPLSSLVTDLEETKNNLVEILNNKGISSKGYESIDNLVRKVDELNLIITSAIEVEEGTESTYPDGTLYIVYKE